MHGPAGGGLSSLHQHIEACGVTVLQTEWRHGFPDFLDIPTRNEDIDISDKPSGVRRSFFHIKIRGQAAYYAILQSGG